MNVEEVEYVREFKYLELTSLERGEMLVEASYGSSTEVRCLEV